MMKLYQEIARLLIAIQNCEKSGNAEWRNKHTDRLEGLVSDYMPSGSGVDCGTKFDIDSSTADKLVFTTSFHHMNDAGMYDGWTEHNVIVRPSLAFEFDLKITGRDRNDIKDYLLELFSESLNADVAS